jgi:hypothetical protein
MQEKCFHHCVKSYEQMDLNGSELECVTTCAKKGIDIAKHHDKMLSQANNTKTSK